MTQDRHPPVGITDEQMDEVFDSIEPFANPHSNTARITALETTSEQQQLATAQVTAKNIALELEIKRMWLWIKGKVGTLEEDLQKSVNTNQAHSKTIVDLTERKVDLEGKVKSLGEKVNGLEVDRNRSQLCALVQSKKIVEVVAKNNELSEKVKNLEKEINQSQNESIEKTKQIQDLFEKKGKLEEKVRKLEVEREGNLCEILNLKNLIASDQQWKSEVEEKLKVVEITEDATNKVVLVAGNLIPRVNVMETSIKSLEEYRQSQENQEPPGIGEEAIELLNTLSKEIQSKFGELHEEHTKTLVEYQKMKIDLNELGELVKNPIKIEKEVISVATNTEGIPEEKVEAKEMELAKDDDDDSIIVVNSSDEDNLIEESPPHSPISSTASVATLKITSSETPGSHVRRSGRFSNQAKISPSKGTTSADNSIEAPQQKASTSDSVTKPSSNTPESVTVAGTLDHQLDQTRLPETYCICGKKCNGETNLVSHIQYHSIDRRFICSLCPMKFIGLNYLKKHMKSKHKVNVSNTTTLGCRSCGLTCANRKQLLKHFKESRRCSRRNLRSNKGISTRNTPPTETVQQDVLHTPKSSTCIGEATGDDDSRGNVETQAFVESVEVIPFSKVSHGQDPARQLHCLCGMKFDKGNKLRKHVRYYERKQICKEYISNKGFCVPRRLTVDAFRTHSKNTTVKRTTKSRKCSTRKSGNQYKCNRCGKTFKTELLLGNHLKTVHQLSPTKTGDPTSIVVDENQQEHGLVTHVSTTIDESSGSTESQVDNDRFHCKCTINYASRQLLLNHLKVIIKGKVFRCFKCPRKFSIHSQLKAHVKNIHKVEYQQGKFACSE